MKKNTKLLALLCAAVLLFSGCSSGTAPESTESTTAATTQSAPDQTQAFETPASETQAPAAERDVTVDFVVVGAGAGGLQAATEAASLGKSVVLLEKTERAGGSSALCEGFFWSAGAKLNEETGIGYDVQKMTDYLISCAAGNANDALLENLCEVSGSVMDQMVEGGVRFLKDRSTSSGGPDASLTVFIGEQAGYGIVQDMVAIAEKQAVDIRYESKAVDLIYEDGKVKGVTVEDADGVYHIYADTTILATGGFLRNEKLMNEYMPEWYYEQPFCGAGSTGDGHEMAMKLGAHMIGYSNGGVWSFDGQNGFHMEGGMAPCFCFFLTNIEGERFCNEYMGTLKNDLIVQQSDRKAYCFMDSASPYVSFMEEAVEKGLAHKADTLEELCEIYGIPVDTFMNTVAGYNQAKSEGRDDPDFGVANDYMVSMTEAPYYATYFDPSLTTNNLMGLACDEYCRLLDADNQPIPGLYGCGELIIGSVVGNGNYPSCGTCLASGIYGGAIAVRHACGQFQ